MARMVLRRQSFRMNIYESLYCPAITVHDNFLRGCFLAHLSRQNAFAAVRRSCRQVSRSMLAKSSRPRQKMLWARRPNRRIKRIGSPFAILQPPHGIAPSEAHSQHCHHTPKSSQSPGRSAAKWLRASRMRPFFGVVFMFSRKRITNGSRRSRSHANLIYGIPHVCHNIVTSTQ